MNVNKTVSLALTSVKNNVSHQALKTLGNNSADFNSSEKILAAACERLAKLENYTASVKKTIDKHSDSRFPVDIHYLYELKEQYRNLLQLCDEVKKEILELTLKVSK